ncbi:PAS domain S-box protein [Pseudomonadota bacterium]
MKNSGGPNDAGNINVKSLKRQRLFLWGAVFLIGLILSSCFFLLVRDWEEQYAKEYFDSIATTQAFAIHSGLRQQQDIISSIARLKESSATITRETFRGFVDAALVNHQDIQALEWIPRVSQSERSSYEVQARLDGFEDFQFTELGSTGQLVVAADREEYFPVYFVEPYKGNEPALGFDLASNSVRVEALQQARDSGMMVTSGRISLVQGNTEEYGYLLFSPVFASSNIPVTLEDKRERLEGYALGVFFLGKTIERFLNKTSHSKIDIWLVDEEAKESKGLLYYYQAGREGASDKWNELAKQTQLDSFYWKIPVAMPGRSWSLIFKPAPEFFDGFYQWRSWIVFFASMFLTLIILAYLYRAERYTRVVEGRASLLAQEKMDSEARYQQLFDSSTDALFVMTVEWGGMLGTFVDVNAEACRCLGYRREELLGRNLLDVIRNDFIDDESHYVVQTLENGKYVYEAVAVAMDSSTFPVEVNMHPLRVGAHSLLIASVRDIAERRKVQESLQESESFFRQLADNIEEIVWVVSPDKMVFAYVSPAYEQIHGRSRAPLYQNTAGWLEYIHAEDRARIAKAMEEQFVSGVYDEEYRFLHADGEIRWLHDRGFVIRNELGEIYRVAGISQDITKRKVSEAEMFAAKESQMAKLSRAVEQAADAIMITDNEGIIEYVNPAFEATTGFQRYEVKGQRPSIVMSGRHKNSFYKRLWDTIASGEVYQDVIINRKKDGSLYYEEKTITPVKDGHGVITHFISSGKDITERMQTEERLHHLAYHDVLTDLPNRAMMMERISHAANQRREE